MDGESSREDELMSSYAEYTVYCSNGARDRTDQYGHHYITRLRTTTRRAMFRCYLDKMTFAHFNK
jgi:hypothetical protein